MCARFPTTGSAIGPRIAHLTLGVADCYGVPHRACFNASQQETDNAPGAQYASAERARTSANSRRRRRRSHWVSLRASARAGGRKNDTDRLPRPGQRGIVGQRWQPQRPISGPHCFARNAAAGSPMVDRSCRSAACTLAVSSQSRAMADQMDRGKPHALRAPVSVRAEVTARHSS